MSSALQIRSDQSYWTPEQVKAYHAAGIRPSSEEQATIFLNYCQKSGLDPFTRQIYLADGKIMVSIDGLRLIAQRSGEYQGQVGPQWCGDDGQWQDLWVAKTPPSAARVGVMRKGFTTPVWGVAMWAEFSKRGTWAQMPAHMLAKVAESHALRKAFPAEMSGLYTDDEMGQQSQRSVSTAHLVAHTSDTTEHVDTDTGEIVEAELLEPGEE